MAAAEGKIPPVVHLTYEKGELIMKEGDYGISIYKILKGRAKVYRRIRDTEVTLATLGPGEIFGEMSFLTKLLEARSASVRALEDVDVEVLHPARLSEEYNKMPPVLKYIINHSLNRLIRMNKLATDLVLKKKEKEEKPQVEPEAAKRRFYRKELDKEGVYRPTGSGLKVKLACHIRDISLGGVGMDISSLNALKSSHNPDDEFEVHTTLPSGQALCFIAKIRSVDKDSTSGRIILGLEFTRIPEEAKKRLRFFLM